MSYESLEKIVENSHKMIARQVQDNFVPRNELLLFRTRWVRQTAMTDPSVFIDRVQQKLISNYILTCFYEKVKGGLRCDYSVRSSSDTHSESVNRSIILIKRENFYFLYYFIGKLTKPTP